MKNYLNPDELPIYDSTLSSLVKRYAPNCFLKDDLVCIKFQREGQLAETVPICPAELQPQMLSEAHSSSTGGHAKDFKTYSRILQLTWWPGLFADVNRFINECNKCQETAAAPRRPNAPLKPLECPKTPLDTVHIDLMGPYPSSYGQKIPGHYQRCIYEIRRIHHDRHQNPGKHSEGILWNLGSQIWSSRCSDFRPRDRMASVPFPRIKQTPKNWSPND